MSKLKETPKLKSASKAEPLKTGEKKPPKKRTPKAKEDNILQPSFKKHCSYCGKPSTHAKILIAGPPPLFPYICDECVEVCVRVLMEADNQDWRSRLISILAIQLKPQKTPVKSKAKAIMKGKGKM